MFWGKNVPDSILVETISIIGLGLIGGSFAKALKENGAARKVVGFDRSPDELSLGLSMGVIDEAAQSLKHAVESADVVVLAVPVRAVESVLAEVKYDFKKNAILTDVGSVKGCFVKAVDNAFLDVAQADRPIVVPGHPIAGSEKSGVSAANSSLFSNHKVILTPLTTQNQEAVALVSSLWSSCGADVLEMGVDHHDDVLAATSHLPHLIAFSLVDTLAGEGDSKEIFKYAAGGFRDFTRIAASDPVMWSDIFL